MAIEVKNIILSIIQNMHNATMLKSHKGKSTTILKTSIPNRACNIQTLCFEFNFIIQKIFAWLRHKTQQSGAHKYGDVF